MKRETKYKYIVKREIKTLSGVSIYPYFKYETYKEAKQCKDNSYPDDAFIFDLSDKDDVEMLKIGNVI
jgi:hypothetical protein